MGNFFAKDWNGAPFELFGTAHLIGLALIALCNVCLIYFRDHSSATARRNFRYALAAILIVNEFAWHLWNWSIGQWTIQTMLPLHLCSVLVWLSAYMLVAKSYAVYEFAYLLGIAGALQALLTPDAGIYGFPHFRFFQVLVSHGAIVTAAIYMTVVEGFRPTWQSVKRVLVGTYLYALNVWVINDLIGSNYLYLARKLETASLLDVLPPWPWYLPIILALAVGFVLLFYLPFALKDMRQKT
ncbi:MAG TPA: TIGR02206 family membrane protein [Anaerolineae bacterium]|nr:TIGR02206 family membrane protein [Anaerolineae bacterium]HQI84402.1 TIGR02206 family membrane protein [Anaerolineae bacterium]